MVRTLGIIASGRVAPRFCSPRLKLGSSTWTNSLITGYIYIYIYIYICIHVYIHTHIHTYIHTCLLLISMLWHRQAIFESKGDKLSFSAEGRIRTQGLRYLFTSRLNACWQTDWAIEDQAKKLELDSPSLWSASIQPTRPYCQLAFAPGSGDIHVCCC